MKRMWKMVKEAFAAWQEDYAPSMGAALSYYTMFSIAPLLLIVIAVAGLVFGEEAARGAIVAQLQGLMGDEGARAVQNMIESVNRPRQGALATIVGVATLLIGATTVFAELQNDLDRIWRAPAQQESSGIWSLLRTRLLSFGMILGIAFLLMVSLVVSAAVSALGEVSAPLFVGWETLAHVLNVAIGFGVFTVLFAMIYKFMPRVDVAWHDVWVGAAVTAALFTVGRFLIGLYLGKSGVASTYGAAGSLVLVMLWVYYSAQIFLLGAEFTWVYAHEYGSRRGRTRPRAARAQQAGSAASPDAPPAEDGGKSTMPVHPAPLAPSAALPHHASPPRHYGPAHGALRERPLAAMALAAATGFALALIARLRSRRRPAHA